MYLKGEKHMNLKIAVCDDDEKDRNALKSALENYYIATDIELSVDLYAGGNELLARYQKATDYQIVLLDIEMPEANGLEIAKTIRSTIDRHVIIVFISNHPQYMQDSFRVHPFYYITKPFAPKDISDLMENVIKEIESSRIIFSLISTEHGDVAINIRDVLYIEVSDSKNSILSFHFYDHVLTTKGTIAHWQEQLKDYNFYQCCRSILINLRHIHYFHKGDIVLDNGNAVPVSRRKEKELKTLFLNTTVELLNL